MNFVTIFDIQFFPQGIALFQSIQLQMKPANLWVICVDDEVYSQIESMNLRSLKPIKLSDVETAELIAVKATRTRAEYCWTLTPFAADFVLQKDPTIETLCFLDADTYFLKNANALLSSFQNSDAEVLITEHAYDNLQTREVLSGRFCVQFMAFKMKQSADIRQRWQKQCLDWCYNRYEDGKFGDQMYLNTWPEDYGERIAIHGSEGYFLAPWNIHRFEVKDAVLFHFHSLRLVGRHVRLFSGYEIPNEIIETIYKPYVAEIGQIAETSQLQYHQSKESKLRLGLRSLYWFIRHDALNCKLPKRRIKYLKIGE